MRNVTSFVVIISSSHGATTALTKNKLANQYNTFFANRKMDANIFFIRFFTFYHPQIKTTTSTDRF